MTTQEQIARHLCKFMDDEWELGNNLYMAEAKKILALVPQTDIFAMVKEFQEKFYGPYTEGPRQLPYDLGELKFIHMREELVEWQKGRAEGDLEQQLDALIDLVYVALGTAYQQGNDFNEGFRRVHAANMMKVRALKAEESKRNSTWDVVKPEGWTPASLADLVK